VVFRNRKMLENESESRELEDGIMRRFWKTVSKSMVLVAVLAVVSQADLVVTDSSIISFYRLDEATTGNLDNSVKGSFSDSAPTGTAQDHDDFNDGTSDGPAWSTMSVGTGSGLVFDKADNDRTRAAGWMNVAQGNYSEGKSFTIMARVYATEAIDNAVYALYVNGYTSGLRLKGTSVGTLTVDASLRDGAANGGTETYWNVTSGAASPDVWWIDKDKWHNVFLIYEANTGLTVAADDGTTFMSYTDTSVPAGFDTLSHGFSDSSRHWFMGTNDLNRTDGYSVYDGRMESVVLWDKALSLSEADAINLTNIPEPATIAFLGIGAMALIRRRK